MKGNYGISSNVSYTNLIDRQKTAKKKIKTTLTHKCKRYFNHRDNA